MKPFDYIAEIDGPQGRITAGRRRILAKGDSGGSTYYENANQLYGEQAATAKFMRGLGEQYLPGATEGYFQASRDYFDPAYAARMAGEAGTTAQQSIDQNRATMTRDMARYGINPASGKWASMNNSQAMAGAALKAGSINTARRGVEDKRLGVAKDFYSSMVGMPSDSAAAAGQAASGFSQLGAAADQRAANNAAGMQNIAAMGYETFFAADGGEIKTGQKRTMTQLHKLSKDVWDAGERFYSRKAKPEMLGSGMARGAGEQLRNRKQAVDAAVDEAAGYAEGGAVRQPNNTAGYSNLEHEPGPGQRTTGQIANATRRAARVQQRGQAAPRAPAGSLWAGGLDKTLLRPQNGGQRMIVDDSIHYAKGGMVTKDGARCMALGGLFKMPPPAQVPLGTPQAPQQQQPSMSSAVKMGKMLKDGPSAAVNKLNAAGGRGMEKVGNFMGSPEVAAQGIGKQAAASGTDLAPAMKAYNEAGMQNIAAGLGKGAGIDATTGLTAAGEQASQLAAQTAAEFGAEGAALTTDALATGMGTTAAEGAAGVAAAGEAMGGMAGALGTAAAAIPWIGAAFAVGSLLDLFNEGGEVGDRDDYTPGGHVNGPGDGTTTSDQVPAWLTDGEFVVNVEAVNMGNNREKLQKMNAAGLAARNGTKGAAR